MAQLDLDTRVVFFERISRKKLGKFSVGQVLSSLHQQFPDGFYSVNGTKHIIRNFGGTPEEFTNSDNSISDFYLELELAGYLERSREEPKPRQRKAKYRFNIKPETIDELSGYQYGTAELAPAMVSLFETLIEFEAKNESPDVLERRILANGGFLDHMATLKNKSPSKYAQAGGKYLDGMLRS